MVLRGLISGAGGGGRVLRGLISEAGGGGHGFEGAYIRGSL